ncbi:MAG: CHAT domain-containing protein [Candidatus Magnetomorum sp.]|nr:CHAT domain-containing protein [Candidatus Magnetomorum sp.]
MNQSTLDVSGTGSGDIQIRAGEFTIDNSLLRAITFDSENGGCTHIQAENVLANASDISSEIVNCVEKNINKGGDIVIRANNQVIFSNSRLRVISDVNGDSGISGDSGHIKVFGKNISFIDTDISCESIFGGKGGNVFFEADQSIFLLNSRIKTKSYMNDAGNIVFKAKNISLINGAGMETRTLGPGKGGQISIIASQQFVISGKNTQNSSLHSAAVNEGTAGNIDINAQDILMDDYSQIVTDASGQGDAGNIVFQANNDIILRNHSEIITESLMSSGGKIFFNAGNLIFLSDHTLSSSVKYGIYDGGDINLHAPFVSALNARLSATAHEGDGGNINIHTKLFVKKNTSMNVSSRLGINGTINIHLIENRQSIHYHDASQDFLDASQWLDEACEHRLKNQTSHFVRDTRDGLPMQFDYWRLSPYRENSTGSTQCCQKAKKYYQNGQLDTCLEFIQKHLLSVDQPDFMDMLYIQIKIYQEKGHYQKILNLSALLKKQWKNSKNLSLNAFFKHILAEAHLTNNHTNKTKQYLQQAESLIKQTNDKYLTASVLNNKGVAQALDLDYRNALKTFEKSLDMINQVPSHYGLKAKILLNASLLRYKANNYDVMSLLKKMDHIRVYLFKMKDSHDKSSDLLCLASLALNLYKRHLHPKAVSIAKQTITSALSASERFNDVLLISHAHCMLGRTYLIENKIEDAIDHANQAIFCAQKGYFPEIEYQAYWLSGNILKKMGALKKAIKAFNQSQRILYPLQNEFFKGFHKMDHTRFITKVRPVYLDLVSALIEQYESMEESPLKADILYRVINAMEHLKTAELEDYYHDECLSVTGKKQLSPKAFISTLPDKTLVIYPVPLKERLIILLLRHNNISMIKTSVSLHQIDQAVSSLCRHIRGGLSQNERRTLRFFKYSRLIYKWLIQPYASELTDNINTLVFVPDGAFRLVPFSALHDGKKYLIETYALAIIPALRFCNIEASETVSNARSKHTKDILLGGLSQQARPRLKFVEQELASIKNMVNSSTVLLDSSFTANNLFFQFKTNTYRNVLLATHGMFSETVQSTFLQTSEQDITPDLLEKLLATGQTITHQSKIELLALSACQTAKGNERAALGLAGLAVKSGAQTVIASLWYIEDKTSALFITKVFQALISGSVSRACALQKN